MVSKYTIFLSSYHYAHRRTLAPSSLSKIFFLKNIVFEERKEEKKGFLFFFKYMKTMYLVFKLSF